MTAEQCPPGLPILKLSSQSTLPHAPLRHVPFPPTLIPSDSDLSALDALTLDLAPLHLLGGSPRANCGMLALADFLPTGFQLLSTGLFKLQEDRHWGP